jgi:dsDNA-specific endonuclease/ATPase MutS2
MEFSSEDEYADCIVEVLKNIKNNKGRIRSALKRCLNELLDPTYYDGKHNISKRAFDEAKKLGISDKIIYMTWQQLGKYKSKNNKSGNGTRAFILEHYYLRKYLREELYGLNNPNRKAIKNIIKNKLKTCIITAEEDFKLNKLGYGSDRKVPKEAYNEAKIKPKYPW